MFLASRSHSCARHMFDACVWLAKKNNYIVLSQFDWTHSGAEAPKENVIYIVVSLMRKIRRIIHRPVRLCSVCVCNEVPTKSAFDFPFDSIFRAVIFLPGRGTKRECFALVFVFIALFISSMPIFFSRFVFLLFLLNCSSFVWSRAPKPTTFCAIFTLHLIAAVNYLSRVSRSISILIYFLFFTRFVELPVCHCCIAAVRSSVSVCVCAVRVCRVCVCLWFRTLRFNIRLSSRVSPFHFSVHTPIIIIIVPTCHVNGKIANAWIFD